MRFRNSGFTVLIGLLALLVVPEARATCTASILQLNYEPSNSMLTFQVRGGSSSCKLDRPAIYFRISPGGYGPIGGDVTCEYDGEGQTCTSAVFDMGIFCSRQDGTYDFDLLVYCKKEVNGVCENDVPAPASTSFTLSRQAKITDVVWSSSGSQLYYQYAWNFSPDLWSPDTMIGHTVLPSDVLQQEGPSYQTRAGVGTSGLFHNPDDRLYLFDTFKCGVFDMDTVEGPAGEECEPYCQNDEPPQTVGDPVRLTTGNVRYSEIDPLPGAPLVRVHNSRARGVSRLFGKGWVSFLDSYARFVTARPNGNKLAVVGLGDGSRFVFEGKDEEGYKQLWPKGRRVATWMWDASAGAYRLGLERADDEYFFEDGTGRVLKRRDRTSGREFAVTYANALPARVVDSWGRSSWTLTTNAQAKRIEAIEVESANLLWRYTYDGTGNLTQVALDTNGAVSVWRTYAYTFGISEVKDAAGRVLESHSYDDNARGASSYGPSGDFPLITYDQPGRVAGETVTTVTSNGSTKSYYIRSVGGVLRTVETSEACTSCGSGGVVAGVTAGNRVPRTQDERGYLTLRDFDLQGRVTNEQTHYRRADCDPATQGTCRLTPDTILTAAVVPTAASVTTTYAYADANWPEKATTITTSSVYAGRQKVERFAFDPATGRALTHTVEGWTGDPLRLETRTTTTAPNDGLLTAPFNPGGVFDAAWMSLPQPKGLVRSIDGVRTDVADVTQMVYYPIDASVPRQLRGQVAAVRNAAGHITRYEAYDEFGNATRVVDPNGVVTESITDALGRVTTSTVKGVTGCDTSSDPLCATDATTIRAAVPALGSMTHEYRAGGGVSVTEYDTRARVKTISRGPTTSDLHERIEYTYDSVSGKKQVERALAYEGGQWVEKKKEEFFYDNDGRLQTLRHPDLTTVVYSYGPGGEIATVKDENHSVANTTYSYDAAGRMERVTQVLSTAPGGSIATSYEYDLHGNLRAVVDPNGNRTTYTFDDFGQMLKQESPVTGVNSYTYDVAGNLLSTADANGAVTTRGYDILGRTATSISTKGGASESVSWSYDSPGSFSVGRVTSMTDPAGSVGYAYERRGLLQRLTRTLSSGGTYITAFTYDLDGLRNRMVYPSGKIALYTFDYAGRPYSLTFADQTIINSAKYYPFGPSSELAYGNGTTRKRTYDSRYRISTNVLNSGATPLISYSYGYDNIGNITSIGDVLTPTYNRSFGYDDLNRLITANTGAALWGSGSYTYDAMGSMKTTQLGTVQRSFTHVGTTPKLATVTENGQTKPVTYDAVGNEATVGTETFDYTPRNHLASAPDVSYVYDGRGVRLVTTTSVAVRSVTLSASSVTGGQQLQATIASSIVAPSGGLTVSIATTGPASAPATVVVPPGQHSVTVDVTSHPVAANTQATITATTAGAGASASFNVVPPVLTNLAVSPATVAGGNPSLATVTLSGGAPPEGKSISLSSNAPSVAAVPSSVIVPSGSSTATANVSTSSVTSQQTATLTASDGANSRTATLTVTLPSSRVQVSASPVLGGQTVGGTVLLTAPAPAGGLVATLSTSNTAVATVPASVTIPAGATSVPFTIQTYPVSEVTNMVYVRAQLPHESYWSFTWFTVLPQTVPLTGISISPTSITGGLNATGMVTLGSAPTSGPAFVALSSGNEAVAQTPSGVVVPVGSTSATFTITTTTILAPQSVTITGQLNGVSQSANLTVVQPSSLALYRINASTPVVGGNSGTARVLLTANTTKNVDVPLTSSNPAVLTVPASARIPRNGNDVNVTFTTKAVSTPTSVTISGTYGGLTQRAVVTVNPVGTASIAEPTAAESSSSAGHAMESAARVGSVACRVMGWRCPERAALSLGVTAPVTTTSATSARRVSIYSPELNLIAETEAGGEIQLPWAHEFVWFAGEPVAQVFEAEVRYTLTDHLGTPIAQTGSSGVVGWRAEFHPYGDRYFERAGSGRHQPLGLPGQEIDPHRSDRYNIFRWYRAAAGRYTQSDPIGVAGGLNLYAYAAAAPTMRVDPYGLVTMRCTRPLDMPGGNWIASRPSSESVQHVLLYSTENNVGCGTAARSRWAGAWSLFTNSAVEGVFVHESPMEGGAIRPGYQCSVVSRDPQVEACVTRACRQPAPSYGLCRGSACWDWAENTIASCSGCPYPPPQRRAAPPLRESCPSCTIW